jgi:1,2-diacylglycerol 3-beta-galactosyltransferase
MFRFLQCFNTCILLQDELRKELEMDEELPAVLLMGGGEGMGPVETTARALGEALYDANTGKPIGQLVVVCGRNKNLVRKLQQVNWKIPIQVFSSFQYPAFAMPFIGERISLAERVLSS